VGSLTSHNPISLQGIYGDNFTFFLFCVHLLDVTCAAYLVIPLYMFTQAQSAAKSENASDVYSGSGGGGGGSEVNFYFHFLLNRSLVTTPPQNGESSGCGEGVQT
jgi:hypothetical protein